jgi:hypothetical protein
MPLRDHCYSPIDDLTTWESFHAGWPMVIVQQLFTELPRRYVAGLRSHPGAAAEIDVSTYEQDEAEFPAPGTGNGNGGGVATAVWAPARPTLTVATDLPAPDEFEVRVYDCRRGRRLVAAVEIVSPANKDRPEHRHAFIGKCAALLQERVSVTVVDLVTTRNFNLYGELLEFIGVADPALGAEPPPLYAVACRAAKPGDAWHLETWLHPLRLGQPLPTLPLWLADNLAVPLELESSYEETCRVLHIS